MLDKNRQTAALQTAALQTVAHKTHHFASIGSTNEKARQMLEEGAEPPFWIVADEQTDGRGRLGRSWEGGKGNLFASTARRLNVPNARLASISLLTGLAAFDAIKQTADNNLPLTLKWPNDILSGGAKLGGILIESQRDPQSGHSDLVIGVGINITSAPDIRGRSTTCLHSLGHEVTRDNLLSSLRTHFDNWLKSWNNGLEIDLIRQEWLNRAVKTGTKLTVSLGKKTIVGAFKGLDENGALQIIGEDGTLKTITSGELL